MNKLVRSTRGDTIIEVMIAMAIIGSVIVLSYATASRALILGRRAQERTEALKLAESTVERIKSFAITDPTSFYAMNDYQIGSYCLEPSTDRLLLHTQAPVVQEVRDDTLVVAANGEPKGEEIYNSNCAVGIDGRYKMSMTRRRIDDDRNEYTIRTRWESLGGGQDEVKLVYRYHRSSTIPELIPPTGGCTGGRTLGANIISPTEILGGLDPVLETGIEPPAVPTPIGLGTNNNDSKLYRFLSGGTFYSQAVFRGNYKYPTDVDGRNSFSFMRGDFRFFFAGAWIDQVAFPGHDLNGDGTLDVPAIDTWFYSNGNVIGEPDFRRTVANPEDLEYLLYGREIGGLVPGAEYVFYAYMTNALNVDSRFDPQIAIKLGGSPDKPDGVLLEPVLQLTEVNTGNTVNNYSTVDGWVRIEGVFTAPGNSAVFKFTDRAERYLGDDFGMTSFGVVKCDAI